MSRWPKRILLAVLGAAGACAGSSSERSPKTVVRLTVGLAAGGAGNRAIGDALARQYAAARSPVDFRLLNTASGSVDTVEAIQRGDTDCGISLTDVTYLAYAGKLQGHPSRFDRLRGVALLDLASVHLLARANGGIAAIGDLRGRSVGVGPVGSETHVISQFILQAFGIERTIRSVSLPFPATLEQFTTGEIQAMFATVSDPAELMTAATAAGARLLSIEGSAVDQLRHEYRFLQLALIPGGVYVNHPSPILTIGVDKVLVCRSDLSEDAVFELTARLFAVMPTIPSALVRVRFVALEYAAATPVPLHPGAARYYRARELFR